MNRHHQSNSWRGVGTAIFVAGISTMASTSGAQPTESTEIDQAARAIVQKADEARFPNQGFEVGVLIRSFEGKDATEAREYRVLSKGNDNTIVMTLQPASERGQTLLMKGRDLWLCFAAV